MFELDHKMELPLAKEHAFRSIQWQWLPILLAFAGIWFYGLWCLAVKIF